MPDDWQRDALDDWLGRDRAGRWTSATCGLAVPRQNGKNGVIEIRELYGMVGLAEKFLHTAHEVKTARKAFLRIASFFENERQYPELAAMAKEIRKTNGQEAVFLTNGGSVEFVARSKGSGRGFTVDVLVCDEAQDLTDEELEALLPTISAAPSGNPQVILTGTPPNPEKNQTGEVFTRVRADGQARSDKRLAWTDYGVADGPLPDVNDRQIWADVNPALGGRLNIAEVERELKLMSPEGFAREREGWWGDLGDVAESDFDLSNWPHLIDVETKPGAAAAFGLAVSFDQKWASIGVAAPAGDRRYLELVEHRPGMAWALGRAIELHTEHGAPFVVDPRGPAAPLIPDLTAAGVPVIEPSTDDVANSTTGFVNGVESSLFLHRGTPLITDAIKVLRKRTIGDGRVALGRKASSADISPVEAIVLAAWGAANQAPPEVWSIAEAVERLKRDRAETPTDEASPAPEVVRPDGSRFVTF